MTSILKLSGRTITKVIKRMIELENLGCSRCGWNEGVGDIHHINGRKIIDPHNHNNLCYLCPNCHRLVHQHKISKNELINLTDFIGDKWLKYVKTRKGIKYSNRIHSDNLVEYRKIREDNMNNDERKSLVLSSKINFYKYGWVGQLSKLLNVSNTQAKRWLIKYMPEIYSNAYVRNG